MNPTQLVCAEQGYLPFFRDMLRNLYTSASQTQISFPHNPEKNMEGPGCSLVRRLGPESYVGLRLLYFEFHTWGSIKSAALTLLAPSVDLADAAAGITESMCLLRCKSDSVLSGSS